jgi:ribosome maturation factor RimP
VQAIVQDSGCEVWDLSIAGPAGNRKLRVFVDKLGGVGIDDITRLSHALTARLPLGGFNLDDVTLEVSSPGAERRLRGMNDFVRFVGDRVNVRYRSGEAERVVEGTLSEVEEATLTVVDAQGRAHAVPVVDLVETRLAVSFGTAPRSPKPR